MKQRWFVIVFTVAALVAPVWAAAVEWEVDKAHSSITFTIRHMVISKVHGRFTDFDAHLLVDEVDPTQSSIRVVIRAGSINTDNPRRDEHLRSADFFDVARFPEIVFQSTRVEKKGENGYILYGKLTLHGVSRDIAIPFLASEKIRDVYGKERGAVEAQFTLDRKDYGLNWSKVMDNGGLLVGNEVTVSLGLEAVKK